MILRLPSLLCSLIKLFSFQIIEKTSRSTQSDILGFTPSLRASPCAGRRTLARSPVHSRVTDVLAPRFRPMWQDFFRGLRGLRTGGRLSPEFPLRACQFPIGQLRAPIPTSRTLSKDLFSLSRQLRKRRRGRVCSESLARESLNALLIVPALCPSKGQCPRTKLQ